MKTIVFYGSPAKDSHTKHLLDETLSVLEGEVKIVDCYNADIALKSGDVLLKMI